MRNLIYRLANGCEVTTLKEAKAANMPYTMRVMDVTPAPAPMTEKRKAMRVKATI